MQRSLLVLLGALLVGGCDTLADAWVRRNFRADTGGIAGFSEGAETFLLPYPGSVGDSVGDAPLQLHQLTAAAMRRACEDRSALFVAPIVASLLITGFQIAADEAAARLDDATERLLDELTSSSTASFDIARLGSDSRPACFVAARVQRQEVDGVPAGANRLWEFGFALRPLPASPDALVIQPLSLVFERTAALVQDGGNVDLTLAVELFAPGPDGRMVARTSTDFLLRGARPSGGVATAQLVQRLRPGVSAAFAGPGDRFAVLKVTTTETGEGGPRAERERAIRQRHQAAVRDAARGILADRLGVEPLPGR